MTQAFHAAPAEFTTTKRLSVQNDCRQVAGSCGTVLSSPRGEVEHVCSNIMPRGPFVTCAPLLFMIALTASARWRQWGQESPPQRSGRVCTLNVRIEYSDSSHYADTPETMRQDSGGSLLVH